MTVSTDSLKMILEWSFSQALVGKMDKTLCWPRSGRWRGPLHSCSLIICILAGKQNPIFKSLTKNRCCHRQWKHIELLWCRDESESADRKCRSAGQLDRNGEWVRAFISWDLVTPCMSCVTPIMQAFKRVFQMGLCRMWHNQAMLQSKPKSAYSINDQHSTNSAKAVCHTGDAQGRDERAHQLQP